RARTGCFCPLVYCRAPAKPYVPSAPGERSQFLKRISTGLPRADVSIGPYSAKPKKRAPLPNAAGETGSLGVFEGTEPFPAPRLCYCSRIEMNEALHQHQAALLTGLSSRLVPELKRYLQHHGEGVVQFIKGYGE